MFPIRETCKYQKNQQTERDLMKKKRKENFVRVSQSAHKMLKILAVEEERKMSGDLIDDIIRLGIEEYRKAKKNLLLE